MMALDRDIQRWVDALRSGAYPQTTERLHSNSGFCCLGVCRDVLGTTWEGNGEIYESHLGEVTVLDLQSLPDGIREFLFREAYDGEPEDVQQHLIELNDDGTPFAEIADWIEANAEATS